jgi:hypothetical protein
VIEQLRLRGGAGSVLWGYRQVAELGSWAIVRALPKDQVRDPGAKPNTVQKLQRDRRTLRGWQLQARVSRADAFQLRQKPLYFTAPRKGAGTAFWCWPLLEPPTISNGVLRALLGKPEQ